MEKPERIDSIADYNKLVGIETLHPMVSIVDFSKVDPFCYFRRQYGVYSIFLKEAKCGNMTYGCNNYDYEEGTLIFIGPGQVYGVEEPETKKRGVGHALVFHPDLLLGTNLGKSMKEYSFFSYEVNEALHLSAKERVIINEIIEMISYELEHAIDHHSKALIVSHIELFLNYCKRFYDRQFHTRVHVNKDLLGRFENLLDEYFNSGMPETTGLPSVRYFAEKLHLSPNYLGDLLRKETGKSAQEHIQYKLIEIAKEKIYESERSISEIAYELGFQYPQHFTRMFKKNTGVSPNKFRSMN